MRVPRELLDVARRLGDLPVRAVFVGGMVRPLLITDPAIAGARHTRDVDLVVDATSRPAYYAVCQALRDRGFQERNEPDAPICRWDLDGVPVDVMPTDPAVLGFSNVWYPEALQTASVLEIDGVPLRVVDPVYFCATKLEAWLSRGGDDLWHHDLEDVIALVDGRPDLEETLGRASDPVRGFVSKTLRELLARRDFVEALPGHLAPDEASQQRLPRVLARLRAMSALRVGPTESEPDEPTLADLEEPVAASPTDASLSWRPVRSSNLRAVSFDPASLELRVEFHSGHRYAYAGVPPSVFEALMAAGSKGAFHARWIRNRYRYRRLR